MTAAAALAGLRAAGVRVWLDGNGVVAMDASAPPAADLLAFARRHRPGIIEILRLRNTATTPDGPAAWLEGVALLATMRPPCAIPTPRWIILVATSARLLRDHGAELHRAGWDVLDLFGLHWLAPVTNPAGWGLAWLIGNAGCVLDVSADVVGMSRDLGGARMAFRRRAAIARTGTVPAWALALDHGLKTGGGDG